MRAYYHDGLPGHHGLPHDSGILASNADIANVGVILWHIPVAVSEANNFSVVDAMAEEREYKTIEVIPLTKEFFGDQYEEKLAIFTSEHMHEEEEIRYVLEGGGYFDVHENATNRWIRFVVNAGDLILLPAGMYHRFTLDDRNMIKARLFFKDRRKWVPHYRGEVSDNNPHRVEYLKNLKPIAVN